MKKLFVIAVSLLSTLTLNAFAGNTLESCKVSRMINENVLDESLSIEEYPDVTVEEEMGQLTLNIGMNTFNNFTDDYTVQPGIVPAHFEFNYVATSAKTGEEFSIKGRMVVNRAHHLTKVGTVTYKNLSTGVTELLAELICEL